MNLPANCRACETMRYTSTLQICIWWTRMGETKKKTKQKINANLNNIHLDLCDSCWGVFPLSLFHYGIGRLFLWRSAFPVRTRECVRRGRIRELDTSAVPMAAEKQLYLCVRGEPTANATQHWFVNHSRGCPYLPIALFLSPRGWKIHIIFLFPWKNDGQPHSPLELCCPNDLVQK